jgi:hypothetical protein
MKESLRNPPHLHQNAFHVEVDPSPPVRGEREGPAPKAWEGEVGLCQLPGIPHLTPTLSAPRRGEGAVRRPPYCLPFAFLAGVLVWGLAGAAEPNAVGIIMKVTGETDPGLPLREEVSANTVIKLGPCTIRRLASSSPWPAGP